MKQFYNERVVPFLIDHACGGRDFSGLRQRVVPLAVGTVLEVGIGPGHNLKHYDRSAVKNVIGVDPSSGVLKRGADRFESFDLPLEIVNQPAEKLDLDDNSIDTVLLTWTGCSIAGVAEALGEMRRVLKPDGQLVFCEHGRADTAKLARRQDWINKVWVNFSGGCNINRDFSKLIPEAGFEFETLETGHLIPGPRPMTFHYYGTARPR